MAVIFTVLLTLTLAGPIPSTSAEPAPTSTSADTEPVIVVLDTSGSMSDSTGHSTRIEVARAAVNETADGLADATNFGLLSYPGSGDTTIDNCPAGDMTIPLGRLDKARVRTAVRNLSPSGGTPTGPAMRHAAEVIGGAGTGGKGTIILISDGESNCGSKDTCDVARELSAAGAAVTTHTVAFEISDEGRAELECIANVMGGKFIDIGENDSLSDALSELAGPELEFSAAVPETIPFVVGEGANGTTIRVQIKNTGSRAATDVRVSLDFTDVVGTKSAVPVVRPVRFLGNLEAGAGAAYVDFVVRPRIDRTGWMTAFVYVSANEVVPARKSYKTRVSKDDQNRGVLQRIQDPVILGDSYSSGEGAQGGYLSGTAGFGGENTCHRSPSAYGTILFSSAVNLACSGAVTADLFGPQTSGDQELEPQLRQLRDRIENNKNPVPDAVLMSIGGNDIGFSTIVKLCLVSVVCGLTIPSSVVNIEALFNDLVRTYRDVDRALNDETAIQRRGRAAPIIVVPYPQITPTDARVRAASKAGNGWNETDSCLALAGPVGLIPTENILVLNEYIRLLNMQIKSAVTTMSLAGRPVYYAEDVVAAFQPRHTICDGADSWAVNSIDITDVAETAHPTPAGHEAMALAIRTWAASATEVQVDDRPVYWNESHAKKKNWLDGALDTVFRPVGTFARAAGFTTNIAEQGYDPLSTVVFYTESFPRVAGTAIADKDGKVRATILIPEDLAPGSHHIEAVGFDKDGKRLVHSSEIYVMPHYTGPVLFLLVLGLVLTVGAAISLRRNRQKKRGLAE